MRTVSLAFALLAGGASLFADDAPVFRSTTRLVQVNVVVHAKDRKPVADLKAVDFTILDNGKPQKVAFFAVQNAAKLSHSAVKLPPNIFSNRFGNQQDMPQSVTAILLDGLNTPWGDQAYARRHVIRFLKQIQPNERVALYSMGNRLRILHDYTTDAASLLRQLNSYTPQHEPEVVSFVDKSDRDTGLLPEVLRGVEQRVTDYETEDRVINTLRTLTAIAEHLTAIPGRKSLIWVSGGFPLTIGFESVDDFVARDWYRRDKRSFIDDVERAVRAMNHANVAIYPVDARGLVSDPGYSAAKHSPPPSRAPMWTAPNVQSMRVLADRTGGKAYYNRNDIDHAVREVFDDSQITYTLGYYPAELNAKSKFREIRVEVNRPDVTVRHRKGYLGFAAPQSMDSKAIDSEIRNALWSPLEATSVGLNVRIERHDSKRVYAVWAQVEPTTITLMNKNGRWTGRIDLAFVQKDAAGKHLSGLNDKLVLNIKPETYAGILKSGLVLHRLIEMAAGAHELRVVARDAPSGLTGSIRIPLSKVVVPAKLEGGATHGTARDLDRTTR